MGRKSPKPPPEDPAVKIQRDRSILDLAKLDEEENRRIKQLRSASRGVRAFRAFRGQRTGGQSVMGGFGSGGTAGGVPQGGNTFPDEVRNFYGFQ